MANITVTNTFSNSTTADATQVNQNFTDIINGTSDGTKDFSISALTCAGNVTFNGNTTIGNASGDDLTVTASLASTIPIKTTNTYDIGSSTKGLRYIYFGDTADTNTHKIQGQAISADVTITLPAVTGTVSCQSRHEVYVDTGNGHGSTATKIRRFTNTRVSTGTDITYADSATNGGTFTINTAGVYAIHYSDYKSTAGTFIAISIDVSSTTTNAASLTYANGRRHGVNTAGASLAGVTSWAGILAAGAVIRAHTDGSPDSTDAFCSLSIARVSD